MRKTPNLGICTPSPIIINTCCSATCRFQPQQVQQQQGQLAGRLQHQIPIIPSRYDPRYNVSFTSNKTGFPLKYCGNDSGGVPNVGNLYICLTTRDCSIIFDREALESRSAGISHWGVTSDPTSASLPSPLDRFSIYPFFACTGEIHDILSLSPPCILHWRNT